ncbi:hypothetical protein ZIOFF_046050 [Zingiber officinale]|uniref:Uncharacterized protein n=1 Tax=Zingiber officinale TaxID=94328 RepID=A0A8J5G1L8_ZINOF|nr:hypothetical protein ZIOFF_046050 [Zingiber officinale]
MNSFNLNGGSAVWPHSRVGSAYSIVPLLLDASVFGFPSSKKNYMPEEKTRDPRGLGSLKFTFFFFFFFFFFKLSFDWINGGATQSFSCDSSPATHPEKPVHQQKLPMDLCCLLEDLAEKLPSSQGFMTEVEETGGIAGTSSAYEECETSKGLQPELFFKMSHEIYNYGEGSDGYSPRIKIILVAALLEKLQQITAINGCLRNPKIKRSTSSPLGTTLLMQLVLLPLLLALTTKNLGSSVSIWHQGHLSYFTLCYDSCMQTIALVAVSEGIVQLGSINKVIN